MDNLKINIIGRPNIIDLNNMPEYGNQEVGYPLTIKFNTLENREKFLKKNKLEVARNTAWYPKKIVNDQSKKIWVDKKKHKNKYPIYVISKGRADTRYTSKALEKMGIDYKIVIEEPEFDNYSKYIDKKKILILPFKNLGNGSIPARNWVWKHSKDKGYKKHWILDDNINSFKRFHNNQKIDMDSGLFFNLMEDYTDRYQNVKISGPQYTYFCPQNSKRKPISYNTRIYSCILLDNDIYPKYEWRGKYNEDTDLSLRILKDGYCSILFSNFLQDKITTGIVKGGNEEIYSNGRDEFVDSLIEQHPDIVSKVIKYNRPHHQVNYTKFQKGNLLKLKKGIKIKKGVNNYGLELKDKSN